MMAALVATARAKQIPSKTGETLSIINIIFLFINRVKTAEKKKSVLSLHSFSIKKINNFT